MKKAFAVLALGLVVVAGGTLVGCKSCCGGSASATAGCADCKDGRMCEACKAKMMANCPGCKAAGGMCDDCKAKMAK